MVAIRYVLEFTFRDEKLKDSDIITLIEISCICMHKFGNYNDDLFTIVQNKISTNFGQI